MTKPRRLHRYTYAEYAALERVSNEKHEFLDGEIFTMAGGTRNHAALAAAVLHSLTNATLEGPCIAVGSDLRIYVEAATLATFPDASVVCGPLQQHEGSDESTALNPSVLVEVTSNSSEEYDLNFKREAYQTIPSLREYIVVSHRERRISVFARAGDTWATHVATRGERIAVPSLETELVVDEIYRKTDIA